MKTHDNKQGKTKMKLRKIGNKGELPDPISLCVFGVLAILGLFVIDAISVHNTENNTPTRYTHCSMLAGCTESCTNSGYDYVEGISCCSGRKILDYSCVNRYNKETNQYISYCNNGTKYICE